jgi:hypothetical protein
MSPVMVIFVSPRTCPVSVVLVLVKDLVPDSSPDWDRNPLLSI